MAHTPLPWMCDETGVRSAVVTGTSYRVARCLSEGANASQRNIDDAEFIVRAANSHYDLLAALKGVLAVADRDTNEFNAARAAIDKAEGR